VARLRNSLPFWIAGVAAIAYVGAFASPFVTTAAVLTLLGILIGSAMNIVMGYAGLINFGIGAFYGIGAYATGILTTKHNLSLWLAALVGVVLAGVIAAISAPFILRTRGLYFAIGTLALGVIGTDIANNWIGLTGGPIGVLGISRPNRLGLGPFTVNISSLTAIYTCTAIVTVAVLVGIAIMGNRRFGRVLVAIREDELLVRSAGFDVLTFKTVAYVASAMIAALAGCLYAMIIQFVSPAPFTFLTGSFEAFVVVAVGGGGTVAGPVIGAVLLVGAPAFLGFSPFVNETLYGVALLFVVVLLRNGIVPSSITLSRALWRRTRGSGEGGTPLPELGPTVADAEPAAGRG
jgi:branched-chain amino acid transport system permease protein